MADSFQARLIALREARKNAPAVMPEKQSRVPDSIRIPELPETTYADSEWTETLRKSAEGERLWPVQSQMLQALHESGGLLGAVGVGWGKALVGLLSGRVLDGIKQTIIFTPAATLTTLWGEYAYWRQFYRMPSLNIYTTESLSQPRDTDLLEDLVRGLSDEQVLIVADEAHLLKDPRSSRTKRLLRFAEAHPLIRWVFLSGTMTSRSVKDFAHLAAISLKHQSPLPLDPHTVEAWAQCLDVDGKPSPTDWLAFQTIWHKAYPDKDMFQVPVRNRQELARKAFQKRLRSSPGVVCSTEGSIGATLIVHGLDLQVPQEIVELMKEASSDSEDSQFDQYEDPWKVLRELSQGFHYIWDWPKDGNGKPIEDKEWLFARKDWNRHVRWQLAKHSKAGYDSPFLVAAQINRECMVGAQDQIHNAWRAWQAQKEKPQPPTIPVWISGFLMDHAVHWAHKQPGHVILWYEHKAVGEALAQRGMSVFGAGMEVPVQKSHTCALAIRPHGVGKQLQAWNRQLIICPPSSGTKFEQALGRTHRNGQKADQVDVFVYQHTDEYKRILKRARANARYIQHMLGSTQKLCHANYVGVDTSPRDELRSDEEEDE